MASSRGFQAILGTGWHSVGRRCRGALALGVGLAVLSTPSRSEACSSVATCWPAGVGLDGDHLPANAPALPLTFSTDGRAAQQVRLMRVDGGRSELVPTHVDDYLRFDEPLAEGARYAVELVDCGYAELVPIAEFEATPTVPLPESLGVIALTPAAEGPVQLLAGGSLSCNRLASGALLEARVELDASAAPWAGLLAFRATIDGVDWFDETYGWLGGSPPDGAGGTRIYRLCDATSRDFGQKLSPGKHELVLHAELPGTEIALETAPVEVELYCDGEYPGESAGASDAGGSGGCSVAGSRSGSLFGFSLVVGACVALRRRRALS